MPLPVSGEGFFIMAKQIEPLYGPEKKRKYSLQDIHLQKTVGKTFYVVEGYGFPLTYRQWYQLGSPDYLCKGEYDHVFKYMTYNKLWRD